MVGGGIFALAGVAFAATGPSALIAFLLNGGIAFITALTFAEMAAANPQSGGMYTFAKKALTVQVAFGVGWVIWFASIVAAVLYAVGFSAFFVIMLQQLNLAFLDPFLNSSAGIIAPAALAVLAYTIRNSFSKTAGGSWINIGKIFVFVIIIAAGFALLFTSPEVSVSGSLSPFFTGGAQGLAMAMGYTFIAVQGFGLISNVSGEIKNPEKNIPRAMMATVIAGMIIYLPLLFVIMTAGVPEGSSIVTMSANNPDAVVAIAVQNFLGPFGFWLVIIGGIFSMLSALQANLFSASRVAFAMAQDRTLSAELSHVHKNYGTPVPSVLVTAALVLLLIIMIPNVASAGAASGLIFLITYTIAHFLVMLLRSRGGTSEKGFRVPLFPYLPIFGIICCAGLALFQAVAEPAAGLIAFGWLAAGSVLFLVLYEKRARVVDAYSEAYSPDMAKLRGHNPLVLVPVINPANASSMVFVANALTPIGTGRVMLLSIISKSGQESSEARIDRNLSGARKALTTCLDEGFSPETLTTIAPEPWAEIARVARAQHCKSLLLGLSNLGQEDTTHNLEKLANDVSCDVVVFRQPRTGWHVKEAGKILIPVAGEGVHDTLRAGILGSLNRISNPEYEFLHILPSHAPTELVLKRKKQIRLFAGRLVEGRFNIKVVRSDSAADVLISRANLSDLVILGIGRNTDKKRVFGDLILRMARETKNALIIISHGDRS